jgi:hypothetical protein
MGSSASKIEHSHNERCLICWEPIHFIELVQCTRCHIQLHTHCEELYRTGKNYCKCPHCQQIGTLGTSRLVKALL